ncbi:hypothetical protein [Terriglobus aquaticus]|uniref:Uncharacterized protein n=1 Tax=Terriglobus aquaticus TaxID=940139 RepID=A0ABW9KMA8_9BACT|nr:hypothetical protein [Terriglobus aquaticus]
MALEGLLSKLGPTLVREVTPHLMQLVAGLGERFRKDTREIKATVDAEMAAIARTHAGLVTSVGEQTARLETLREQVTVVDRKVELLHKAVETLGRQLSSEAEVAAKAQRVTRAYALVAALFSALACGAAVASILLHR